MNERSELSKALWTRFTRSGSISDYLSYIEASKANIAIKNSDQNRIPEALLHCSSNQDAPLPKAGD